jgi:two-component system, response regulator RegA
MPHVLIVDDEPATARSLGRVLRAAGYSVVIAGSCASARKLEDRFDCAVLDIDLGDGSGIDLANELTARGSVARVVFYSGTMDDAVVERVTGTGPLVMKAEPVARLLEEVERVLEPGQPGEFLERGSGAPKSENRGAKTRTP